jgi:hypothetical protein
MMSDDKSKPRRNELPPVGIDPQEGFLDRWSRRKAFERSGRTNEDRIDEDLRVGPSKPSDEPPKQHPTDADMPPIESLNESSDFSGFMSPQVRDGLDDYDEDFRSFEVLKDIVTADMRHQMERKVTQDEDQTEEIPDKESQRPEPVKTDTEQVAAVNSQTTGEGAESHASDEDRPFSSSS